MPDITSDFMDRLKTNGRVARVMAVSTIVGGIVGGEAAIHTWFYFKVWNNGKMRNNGAWDLKNNVYKKHKATGVDIGGRHYDNDMPGNETVHTLEYWTNRGFVTGELAGRR